MDIIDEMENMIGELEQSESENSYALVCEYKNSVAILKGEKLITSDPFTHVIDDMKAAVEFDVTKADEYQRAIEKLQNASI
ncbi:MAG: hypothetical protein QUS12_15515 [Methanosarcina sp.]|nr:hypothetical protein [Methanosarcina sp.]